MNNKPALIAFVLLMFFISGSIWLVFEYVSTEKQRDIDDWQARLSIMAESQQHTVENWLDRQLENINSISEFIHKTAIHIHGPEGDYSDQVNEEITGSKNYNNPIYINRPFIFFIREKLTGAIVFVGKVNDPTLQ